jgi:MGT family glycosyltransferase
MSNYLFVTVEGGGNIPPVLGLARRLVDRGHTVTVLTEPCLRGAVEAAGARFFGFERYFVREDVTEDLIGDSEAANPIAALKLALERLILGPSRIVAEETRRAMDAAEVDVVAADVMTPGALIAAEAAGVPRVVLFHMPEYLPGPGRPAAGPGFLPRTDLIGRVRDAVMPRLFYRLVGAHVGGFNEVRRDFGLAPFASAEELVGIFHTADRRLIFTTREFDFPIDPGPANVRYVGPILDDPSWAHGEPDIVSSDDERPLVVVGFSTTPQGQRPALERVIDALGRLPVRGLVTLGPAMARERFATPPNVTVVAGASHARLFPHAAAVITHAGHGTTMRALASGVPLLCMPMGRDQNDNAARVFWHGAGLRLKPSASPTRIAKAVRRLLDDPRFARNARRLGDAIVRDAAEERGVAEMERVGRPAAAPEPVSG